MTRSSCATGYTPGSGSTDNPWWAIAARSIRGAGEGRRH